MKAATLNTVCRFSLLFILSLMVACKKDGAPDDDSNGQLYTLTLDFKDFDASIRPLYTFPTGSYAKGNMLKANGATSQTDIGYLYFWSFNAENTTPDIAIQTGASIAYNAQGEPTFPNGWAFDDYPAGSALSIRGLSELLIRLPIRRATALQDFGFDISSSGTGPKDFTIEYSFDQTNWAMKSDRNQFANTNPNGYPKNSFLFDFSELPVENRDFLYVRISMRAGERGSSGNFNPTQGVTKIDNIRLTGVGAPPTASPVDDLHYHVFDALSHDLVTSDVRLFDPENARIDISLPRGRYEISFVRNLSAAPLIWPNEVKNSQQFYYSNAFSNHLANVFATEVEINLDGDKQESIVLNRYYSQIKFEFTDDRSLSHVDRIIVTPLHEPFFYAPYNTDMVNPVLDQSELVLSPNFAESNEIVFNQFLGKLAAPRPVGYRLDVYGQDGALLRSFDVSASIRNNVQVVFRGELLSGVNQQTGFDIRFNEVWDDEVVIGF